MEKYIMIFEDGKAYKSDAFTDDDKEAVDSGLLEVIRQSDLKSWYDGGWNELGIWGA